MYSHKTNTSKTAIIIAITTPTIKNALIIPETVPNTTRIGKVTIL